MLSNKIKEGLKNKNLNNISVYVAQNYFTQFLNVIFTILSVRLLSISDLGKLNLAKSIGNSFEYTHLGTRFTIDRKIPECDFFHKNIILSVSFYVNLVASFLVFVSIVLFGRLDFFYYLFFIGFIVLANINLARVFVRANGESNFFIRLSFILNISSACLQIIGLLFWGIWGIVILSLVNNFMFFVFLFEKKIRLNSFHEIRLWYYKYSLNKGFVYFFNALLAFFSTNADRILVNHFDGEAKVGEYSIIFFFFSFMMMIPNSIGELIYPEFIKRKKNIPSLVKYIQNSFKLFTISVIAIEILVLLFLKPSVDIFFPKYSYLIHPMIISTLAIIPYCVITVMYFVLFSYDNRFAILFSNLIATVVFLAFLTFFLANGYGNNYLAFSKVLYSFVYAVCLLVPMIKIYKKLKLTSTQS